MTDSSAAAERPAAAVNSPNAPRPHDPQIVYIADTLRRIEGRYAQEGSGPSSRFEGRLLEDVQAEAVVRMVREDCAQFAEQEADRMRSLPANDTSHARDKLLTAAGMGIVADLIRARSKPTGPDVDNDAPAAAAADGRELAVNSAQAAFNELVQLINALDRAAAQPLVDALADFVCGWYARHA